MIDVNINPSGVVIIGKKYVGPIILINIINKSGTTNNTYTIILELPVKALSSNFNFFRYFIDVFVVENKICLLKK